MSLMLTRGFPDRYLTSNTARYSRFLCSLRDIGPLGAKISTEDRYVTTNMTHKDRIAALTRIINEPYGRGICCKEDSEVEKDSASYVGPGR